MIDPYQETMKQSRQLAQRMRMGTGAANLLHGQEAPTHYIDSLERFQKDFASYDKVKREQQKERRQRQLQRKRIEQLERQNKKWVLMEEYDRKLKSRQQQNFKRQNLGVRKTANSNGLAYNPINLEYDRNPQGEKLRTKDQDNKIRGFVRAHNMDTKGNCKYNLLNGEDRLGIDQVVPQQLHERYQYKLSQHYDNQRVKIPSSSNSIRSNTLW